MLRGLGAVTPGRREYVIWSLRLAAMQSSSDADGSLLETPYVDPGDTTSKDHAPCST